MVVQDGVVEGGGVGWAEGRVAVVGKVVAPARVSMDVRMSGGSIHEGSHSTS